MTHPKHLTDYHFYASSCATWATTTPDRDLPALIELMNGTRPASVPVPAARPLQHDAVRVH